MFDAPMFRNIFAPLVAMVTNPSPLKVKDRPFRCIATMARTSVRSSLAYQLLLYCNAYYFAFMFFMLAGLLIYKDRILPYPRHYLGIEWTLLILLVGIEAGRNFFGQKGNLTEQMVPVVFSLVLSVPALVGALYFLLWQTYVLRVEVIVTGIQLAFILLEIIFGVIAVATFARSAPV